MVIGGGEEAEDLVSGGRSGHVVRVLKERVERKGRG